MKLYGFPTSSATYRVRIALHLKGIPFETVPINLPGKEQRQEEYLKINPQHRVPSLQLDDGTILTQSFAIIDYLEQIAPTPAVYPADSILRARAMAVAMAIGAEIQAVSNSSVTDYVESEYGQTEAQLAAWRAHFLRDGFRAIEQLIDAAPYAFGMEPSIADIFIVPQVFNAYRFNCDITDFPKILAVNDVAKAHPAFEAAHPRLQPGA
jgi:maleylacetoacetate isomerase/maleylpyruvate isomerase